VAEGGTSSWLMTFLTDLVGTVVSICMGLWVTLVNLLRRKATVNYPLPGTPQFNYRPRPGYRGDFGLITNRETGRLNCTACLSCERICPDKCIHVVPEGKGKERHPTEFYVDLGLCQFCWLCVESCPFDAITMTPDYEQAVDDPRKLIRTITDLSERGKEYEHILRVETAPKGPEERGRPVEGTAGG
jgi:formate hydrogenlyase subunit 6/NADH:ubiquinone oxidoreductase subunit I